MVLPVVVCGSWPTSIRSGDYIAAWRHGGLAGIHLVVATTVLLSVIAHGMSTNPLIERYGRRAETFKDDAQEKQGAPDAAVRHAA